MSLFTVDETATYLRLHSESSAPVITSSFLARPVSNVWPLAERVPTDGEHAASRLLVIGPGSNFCDGSRTAPGLAL